MQPIRNNNNCWSKIILSIVNANAGPSLYLKSALKQPQDYIGFLGRLHHKIILVVVDEKKEVMSCIILSRTLVQSFIEIPLKLGLVVESVHCKAFLPLHAGPWGQMKQAQLNGPLQKKTRALALAIY